MNGSTCSVSLRVAALFMTVTSWSAFAVSPPSSSPEVVVELSYDSVAPPALVEIQGDSRSTLELRADSSKKVFSVSVPRPSLASGMVVNPIDLVIDWPEPNETIFLNVGPLTPDAIRLRIDGPNPQPKFSISELLKIENLPSDEQSLLKRYLHARRFHQHWRARGLPDSEVAIRSARAWFDASVNLVKRRPQTFALDRDIRAVIDDYKARSVSDATLASRVGRFFPSFMVASEVSETRAAPYAFVGKIPELVATSRISDAVMYNDLALRSLEASSSDEREAVKVKQGITAGVLEGNRSYLENLSGR